MTLKSSHIYIIVVLVSIIYFQIPFSYNQNKVYKVKLIEKVFEPGGYKKMSHHYLLLEVPISNKKKIVMTKDVSVADYTLSTKGSVYYYEFAESELKYNGFKALVFQFLPCILLFICMCGFIKIFLTNYNPEIKLLT